MATKTRSEIIRDGLWTNNPALVQVLGLCPLLAVTSTVVNAIGLGLATLMVLTGSNLAVSVIRTYVTDSVRLPAFVMIIASLVTCAELLMQAFTYELYQILGIFIPLIVTNCAILGRADAFASRNSPGAAVLDGAMMGAGFLVVLVVLGGMREIVGQGTLFANMELLLGPMASDWQIGPVSGYPDVLFMVLPPGAFVGLGLLIALKNRIDYHIAESRRATAAEGPVAGSKRVRVTGQASQEQS
ncbi:electron transport complex subunit E [Marinobacter sp.]|uniref:electron transport complex subunit E n=1 Tax=Marinobacter sp. TaxID=50741 RepID=UPI00384DDD71